MSLVTRRRAAPVLRARALLAAAALLAGAAEARPVAADSAAPPHVADPVAAAIRDLAGDELAPFYRDRGWWPLWSAHGRLTPAARALATLVRQVSADGLDPDDYAPGEIDRALAAAASGDPRALAATDVFLSSIFAELVADMRDPRGDAVAIDYADPALRPVRPAALAVLRRAAVAPDLARYIRDVAWMHPIYRDLRRALLETTPVGEPGPRVRLDLAELALFDAAAPRLAPARPGDARVALLRRNLARARLLPDAQTRHIVVDAAGSRLWYYADGVQAGTMRVVTGTPDTPTPMLAGTIAYATLNPYWNVPVDLVRKRIAPKVLAGQPLPALGYQALESWDGDTVIDWQRVDWRGVAAGRVEARVRELPGRANSMGTVKFTFPNDEGIYLHDTNNHALFQEADRHFSNGCVRLEDAPRLARWLFGHDLAPATGKPEEAVALPRPVPVYILYFTALPGEDGIATVADVYSRDAAPPHG